MLPRIRFELINFFYRNVYKYDFQKQFMVNGVERPLDVLNSAKGKEVLVQLKNNRQMVGTLLAFDIHINVVLDNAREIVDGESKRSMGLTFLRGDTIIFISPASMVA